MDERGDGLGQRDDLSHVRYANKRSHSELYRLCRDGGRAGDPAATATHSRASEPAYYCSRMARLPYPDLTSSSEAVREALAALPPLNIFRMLAHAETVLRPYLRFGGTILGSLELDPKLRELAILQVAKLSDAEYEWVQHAAVGRHVGLTDEQIAAVQRGDVEAAPPFDDLERAVLAFTAEVVAGPRVSDAAFAGVSRRLSPREIVELLLTIGNYLALARIMTTLEIDIDAAVGGALVDPLRSA
jgi:alkylhydroperoxidase family enzyme